MVCLGVYDFDGYTGFFDWNFKLFHIKNKFIMGKS